MKKIMFFLAVLLIGGWSYAQDEGDLFDAGGGGDGSFFFSIGPGIAFSASGRNISTDHAMPTVSISVGGKAKEIILLSVNMRGLTPFSPTTRDSSLAQRKDSSFYYRRFFEKSTVLTGSFGFHSGGEDGGLGGGIFTSGGVAFMEKGDKIYTPPVWELTLEGEYGFSEFYGVSISSTCSYIFANRQLGTDGFALILEVKFKYRF